MMEVEETDLIFLPMFYLVQKLRFHVNALKANKLLRKRELPPFQAGKLLFNIGWGVEGRIV